MNMTITPIIVQEGFDREQNFCWAQARVGRIGDKIVLTDQKFGLSQDESTWDVYDVIHSCYSTDGGTTFSPRILQENFRLPPSPEGYHQVICDFVPDYNTATGTLLGTGGACCYENTAAILPSFKIPYRSFYTIYDSKTHTWGSVQPYLDAQGEEMTNFHTSSCQRYDLDNGDIIQPVYKLPEDLSKWHFHMQVHRFSFDGQQLIHKEAGNNIHWVDSTRGLSEPAVTRFNGKFYLTVRSDEKIWVSTSNDGVHFMQLRPWLWDTGLEVPSHNTQQKWIVSQAGLFLVYTRKNGQNEHVFRHRGPLYICQVDPDRLCLLRHTEQVVVPERGARIGNFGITHVSDQESWVTVAEIMYPVGCEKYGSNNAVFLSKIHWD